jgi:AP2-associated kinase
MGSVATHIQDKEIKRLDYEANFVSAEPEMAPLTPTDSATNITSDVDFLKAKEEEKERKVHHKRLGSGSRHMKRTSLPSMGIAGTTKLLAGKFGDAFKMFESNDSGHHRQRSDSPSRDPINVLTPIAGSEATDLSDDRPPFDEAEDLTPEMRRELEKRKLEAEERRVANAAAEYRQRLAARGGGGAGAGGGGGGSVKAASIQNRVQSLFGENDRPAQKTATGYGRFTESPALQETSDDGRSSQPSRTTSLPSRGHPVAASAPTSALDLTRSDLRAQRPIAPPKPKVLRTTMEDAVSSTSQEATSPDVDEDWQASFSKKYPSLAGLEMVETAIETKPTPTVRTREV